MWNLNLFRALLVQNLTLFSVLLVVGPGGAESGSIQGTASAESDFVPASF